MPLPFIACRAPGTKNSFNALFAAIDQSFATQDVAIRVATNWKELATILRDVVWKATDTTTAPPGAYTSRPMVAFSFCTPALWKTAELLSKARARFGERIVCIAGGPHPTADPEGTLELGFDIAVRGEGEETLPELLSALMTGKPLNDIQGIAYIGAAGRVVETSRRPWSDSLDRFDSFAQRLKYFGPIEITRGCPYACSFCQTTRLFGARPRHRSVESVCRHAAALAAAGMKHIRFLTPSAFSYGSETGKTVHLDRLERLLSAVRETIGPGHGIYFGSFPSEARPEHVTPDTLALLRRYANNNNLVIGAQSGSDRMLERLHRGHTVADVVRAVEHIRAARLEAYVDFIFGLPGETDVDLDDTFHVIDRLVRLGAKIHAHAFLPLPGTPLGDAEARPLSPVVIERLHQLIPKGLAFGQWSRQSADAHRIADLRRDPSARRRSGISLVFGASSD